MVNSKLVQKSLVVGNKEVWVFQLSDGSYRISLEMIAKILGISCYKLLSSLRSKSLLSLFRNESKTQFLEKIVRLSQPGMQGVKESLAITTEEMITILVWQSGKGNKNALGLLNDLASVSLAQYLECNFGAAHSELEGNMPMENCDAFRVNCVSDNSNDPVWQAYLHSEREREEVYSRLASS
jgi:hypothetical protein